MITMMVAAIALHFGIPPLRILESDLTCDDLLAIYVWMERNS